MKIKIENLNKKLNETISIINEFDHRERSVALKIFIEHLTYFANLPGFVSVGILESVKNQLLKFDEFSWR